MFVGLGIAVFVGTKGRNFDQLATHGHMHNPKPPPNDARAAKHPHDLLGRGAGGNVKIHGLARQEHITHRAAHDIGFKPRLLQAVADL